MNIREHRTSVSTTALQAGVRKALACGGLLYGAGFGVAALGVSSHNIGLMYFGKTFPSHQNRQD